MLPDQKHDFSNYEGPPLRTLPMELSSKLKAALAASARCDRPPGVRLTFVENTELPKTFEHFDEVFLNDVGNFQYYLFMNMNDTEYKGHAACVQVVGGLVLHENEEAVGEALGSKDPALVEFEDTPEIIQLTNMLNFGHDRCYGPHRGRIKAQDGHITNELT